jgi:hypothetical protein
VGTSFSLSKKPIQRPTELEQKFEPGETYWIYNILPEEDKIHYVFVRKHRKRIDYIVDSSKEIDTMIDRFKQKQVRPK